MAVLNLKDSNGLVIMPDSIPLVDLSDALYVSYSAGNKSYTATKRCVAFTAGSGQTAISVVSGGETKSFPSGMQWMTIQLNAGDKISVPGYSSWNVGLAVYGVKYPS